MSKKSLIIVESPSKIKSISNILGDDSSNSLNTYSQYQRFIPFIINYIHIRYEKEIVS